MIDTNRFNGITYNVVGRYMNGTEVLAYHLVGSDGSQVQATKERLIFLIGKGLVENMRVQANGNELVLRGKGINLTTLPIYDEKKSAFRGNQASQDVANTGVNPKKNSGINPMGQLKITKRIMYKTSCLGYMVVDNSGKERKLGREKVIELALQKLLSNATVQKYKPEGAEERLILRGAGCDLSELPALIVDAAGKIIDPNSDTSEIKLRAARMKRGGILYDNIKNTKYTFEPGDYIVCGIKGVLRPIKAEVMASKFKVDKSTNVAICDSSLEGLYNYPVEAFGTKAVSITSDQVLKWAIVYKENA